MLKKYKTIKSIGAGKVNNVLKRGLWRSAIGETQINSDRESNEAN